MQGGRERGEGGEGREKKREGKDKCGVNTIHEKTRVGKGSTVEMKESFDRGGGGGERRGFASPCG